MRAKITTNVTLHPLIVYRVTKKYVTHLGLYFILVYCSHLLADILFKLCSFFFFDIERAFLLSLVSNLFLWRMFSEELCLTIDDSRDGIKIRLWHVDLHRVVKWFPETGCINYQQQSENLSNLSNMLWKKHGTEYVTILKIFQKSLQACIKAQGGHFGTKTWVLVQNWMTIQTK